MYERGLTHTLCRFRSTVAYFQVVCSLLLTSRSITHNRYFLFFRLIIYFLFFLAIISSESHTIPHQGIWRYAPIKTVKYFLGKKLQLITVRRNANTFSIVVVLIVCAISLSEQEKRTTAVTERRNSDMVEGVMRQVNQVGMAIVYFTYNKWKGESRSNHILVW